MPLTPTEIRRESKVAHTLEHNLDNLVRDLHFQAGRLAYHLHQHSLYHAGIEGSQEHFSDIRDIARDAVKDVANMVYMLKPHLDWVLERITEMDAEIEELEKKRNAA
jgi:hypothetical protein